MVTVSWMKAAYHELYWSNGDSASQTDPENNRQNATNQLGSMIRISVPSDGTGYIIPTGNLPSESQDVICGYKIAPSLAYGVQCCARYALTSLRNVCHTSCAHQLLPVQARPCPRSVLTDSVVRGGVASTVKLMRCTAEMSGTSLWRKSTLLSECGTEKCGRSAFGVVPYL